MRRIEAVSVSALSVLAPVGAGNSAPTAVITIIAAEQAAALQAWTSPLESG